MFSLRLDDFLGKISLEKSPKRHFSTNKIVARVMVFEIFRKVSVEKSLISTEERVYERNDQLGTIGSGTTISYRGSGIRMEFNIIFSPRQAT